MNFISSDFIIQINYKSGTQVRFWCKKFQLKDGRYSWESTNKNTNDPLLLGASEIESFWQKGMRFKLFGITIFRWTRK